MSSKKTIKSAFESMLFTWGEPLDAKAAADVFNITKQEAIDLFKELQREYEEEGRGIVIRQINQSFQFVKTTAVLVKCCLCRCAAFSRQEGLHMVWGDLPYFPYLRICLLHVFRKS